MKTAIIIGNGKIGSAIAHHLWFQHNYSVVNTDRRVLDLSDLYEVGCFFQNIGNTEIDCLVNAAGTYGAIGKVGDVTPEAWAEAIAVNLVGVYACCHHAIKRMKPGSLLINVSRGALVHNEDLIAALDRGRPGTAALDVVEGEPTPPASVTCHPRVIATPHIAFSSPASVDELRQRVVEEVIRVLAGEAPRNLVPPP